MPVIQKLRPQGYASIDVRRAAVKLFEEGYGYKAVAARIGLNVVKRQPDGPTNRHKNDPLVRVGYLLQETA